MVSGFKDTRRSEIVSRPPENILLMATADPKGIFDLFILKNGRITSGKYPELIKCLGQSSEDREIVLFDHSTMLWGHKSEGFLEVTGKFRIYARCKLRIRWIYRERGRKKLK